MNVPLKVASAHSKNVRISPQKVRQVLALIRGKSVASALSILKFSNKRAAKFISNVLNSAVANAEHNFAMDIDKLFVASAFANNATMLKRFRPVSMGRAHPYVHRCSHITISVAEA